MSLLAHTTFAAPGFEAEKRDLGAQIKHETSEAKAIQQQTGCSWSEAMRLVMHKADTEWDNWKAPR